MFRPVDSSLFFSRGDLDDPRFGDLAHAAGVVGDISTLKRAIAEFSLKARGKQQFALVGYPDDEGIQINGGRLGAALAPKAVRKPLYKMTPALPDASTAFAILDLGDLDPGSLPLDKRHDFAAQLAKESLNSDLSWISIGGGHDYGFPDADAFLASYATHSPAPLVINFDAHLDVRPTTRGLSSGTPFFRMLEKFPGTEFIEVGIQAHCNSLAHLKWAESRGVKVIMQDAARVSETLTARLKKHLGSLSEASALSARPTFISVDIDGFSSSVAPGCSQSWATGFSAEDFFQAFDFLTSALNVRALGVYEVSPPLDHDDRTAKLAAQIIHRFVSSKTGVR